MAHTTYAEGRVETRVDAYVKAADVLAKAGLVLLLLTAMREPDLGNMRDKAAGLRAIGYPLVSFTLPLLWFWLWRQRAPFPWMADLLVTVTCFSDILGNRMDLYDTVWWFDDWMHLVNLALLTTAVLLLTMDRRAGLGAIVERSLAFGGTAAIAWELAEYFAFINGSSEREFAYADTLGDLALGMIGALIAAVAVRSLWAAGRLTSVEPVVQPRRTVPS